MHPIFMLLPIPITGSVLAIYSLYRIIRPKRSFESGEESKGILYDCYIFRGPRNRRMITPIYEYKVNGRSYLLRSKYSSNSRPNPIVKILYNPIKPTEADFKKADPFHLASFCFGLSLTAFTGLAMYLGLSQ